MKIKKVALHELAEFVQNEEFNRLETKPITPKRAESYRWNPHASPNDVVLYLLFEGNKLLAFRSIWAGRIKGERESFGWLSGTWVHSDFRRQGLSQKLLDEALADWKNRLMLTNFSPAAEKLILKTQKFECQYHASGERFYLFAKTEKLLKERFPKLSFVFPIADFFIRQLAKIKVNMFQLKQDNAVQTELLEKPDPECYELLEEIRKQHLFRNGARKIRWILKFPWISSHDTSFIRNYPFSSHAEDFRYYTLKLFLQGKFQGFLIYSIRDGHLKPLFIFGDDEILEPLAKQLSQIAIDERVEIMTVLDPQLSASIKKTKNPFLHSKKQAHKIYSSFKTVVEHRKIQAGDGDFAFS